uniref:M1-specific T cell receptor beta chain n=1 Tax=Semicossyphus pulcher TaxID=241346 RepID=UPI0037E741E7
MILGVTLTFCLLWAAAASQSVLITQWPRYISSHPSGSAQMQCYQNNTDYNYLYWYRQLRGKGFELMVYIAGGTPSFEKGFNSGYKAERSKDQKKQWSLTIQSVQEKDEAVYLCAATRVNNYEPAYFGKGTKLTVLEKDRDPVIPTVRVLPPSPKECGQEAEQNKKKKTIVCVASGFYPDHVSVFWSINGENKTSGVATDSAAVQEDKSYSISSRLRVSAKDWNEPENKFTCTVNFYNGTNYLPVSESIRGVEGGEGKVVSRETFLRVTVSAKLSYTVFIVKSCFYGAFVTLLVWKLQASAGKQTN